MKTIGDFYKEKILPRNDLVSIHTPALGVEGEVIRDLFGWRLDFGSKQLHCSTEQEGRYLKVFFDSGMTEVMMPKDQKYVESILPELETIKTKIDRIINIYLKAVLNNRVRNQVRRDVYQEIIQ